MNLLLNLIRPYLYTLYGIHRVTHTGAFDQDKARMVPAAAKPSWNELKQALWRFHVKQFHDSSCSVASVVSCVNAIRFLKDSTAPPIRQTDILNQVTSGHWKERMSENGYNGRRGLPLPILGQVVKGSIKAYSLRVGDVDIVQMPQNEPNRSPIKQTLRKRLMDFDQHGNGLVIAHFDQGTFLPTFNIPHISPVGAYDAKRGLVTMLDVDQELKEPYQVGFSRFCEGLSCNYHRVFQLFGYTGGGYVYISMR